VLLVGGVAALSLVTPDWDHHRRHPGDRRSRIARRSTPIPVAAAPASSRRESRTIPSLVARRLSSSTTC
jgi:hypothetical protein